jgi:putative oligomerization/nucleic acid binding protein
MKHYNNQLFTLICSLLLVFCNSVFAVDFFEDGEDIIWKSGLNLYFKYVKQDSSKFGKNDHPVKLNAKDISLALKALEFSEKSFLSREIIRTIFSVSQGNLFSKQIANGLKNAKPGQDIIFVMEGGSSKLILLNEKNFVAGRVFYKEGRLNIILGEYDKPRNDAFESTYDPSGRAAVPYSFNHGQRSTNSKNFKGSVIGVPGVENKNFGKKLRNDWFIIDVETASKAYFSNLNEKKNPSANQDKRLQVEAAKLARERREMRAEMARMRKEMKELSPEKATTKSPEERIVTLGQLRDKELITQEEYDARRKEILNDI